ncbi:MAG: maltose alpha-D-glucosyltransferase [Planctomycetota bacterium]
MSDSNPLWYKDAVIYQLHVRAFADSAGDGIGDFRGLTQRLDYIQDLGASAIWLLPFFPSPLRDDGYDIADYTGIHPSYGTLQDFKAFLRAAHRRGLKVIIELVLNHTSDQHPWFQRARRAKAGSRFRDFYVWSDTPDRYRDARIIFKDFETSNWTWDPVAQAYYWHRFYSHQPDLNYENPEVRKAMFQVLDHWLSMGVDGLRLDAVPYLFEREGTNCENLPETHAFLREVRAHVDKHYRGRMLLAEANQWPEDAAAYFGQGDETHTAFHFPVMPRMFMAVQMEDRFPIIDIMQQTPEIPESCQWVLFLRNHDELTLEMVTDEERDYMYRVYAHNPQARVNLGIRRRLAPLMGNHRRKIELLNSLLMSLPGTPVIYYGDELGMGDNIYLGDRNGVRTPMQWSPDRNAGFSNANPQQLFLPLIIDHEYHYEAVNVENSRRNPYSLFWWTKRLVALRQRSHVFSRGSLRFLLPDNPRVLAYIRSYEDQSVLVVANLSRFSQFVELDLAEFRGMTPIELYGQTPFPRIGELPYLLTLGPYSYYWFSLEVAAETMAARDGVTPQAAATETELPQLGVTRGWERILQGRGKSELEKVLPRVLATRRWFGGKAKAVRNVTISDTLALEAPGDGDDFALCVLSVEYVEDEPESYLLPLGFASGTRAEQMLADLSSTIVARLKVIIEGEADEGVLYDAFGYEPFNAALLELIAGRRRIHGVMGRLQGQPLRTYRALRGPVDEPLPVRPLRTEQSNSSVAHGDRLLLKLFRRLETGTNPDLELGAFLTERARFPHIPPVAGSIEYRVDGSDTATVAILQGFVRNEGDAWTYSLDAARRFFDRVTSEQDQAARDPEIRNGLVELAEGDVPAQAVEMANGYLESASLLGQRTAEMHLALASAPEDPALCPEPFSELYVRSLYQSQRGLTRRTYRLLRSKLRSLPEEIRADVESVLSLEQELVERFQRIVGQKIGGARIRCHGDYHLGQVLFTGKDFVIIDFEGEPLRRISERRIKRSPLRDVAGMIRSFDYAGQSALLSYYSEVLQKEAMTAYRAWARYWSTWASAAFLRTYLKTLDGASFLPAAREQVEVLLELFLLEKAVYELGYELNNRPSWVHLPIQGILGILDATR